MLLRRLIDFLFPSRCVACGKEHAILCDACRARIKPALLNVTRDTYALGNYADEVLRPAIHALKFKKQREVASEIARLLVTGGIIPLTTKHGTLTLAPIPSSKRENRQRGYDHLDVIMTEIEKQIAAEEIEATIDRNALKKTKTTKRQVETGTRAARLTNLKGAFAAKQGLDLSGKTILLIDDVTTTGATFAEARRALETARPDRVIALALLH